MAIDPVCKMIVDEKAARDQSEYKGTIYYFCAPGCKKIFDESPESYIGKEDRDIGEMEHE
jgi:YHS domain-containing protein